MDDVTAEQAVALLAEKGKPLKAKPGAKKAARKPAPKVAAAKAASPAKAKPRPKPAAQAQGQARRQGAQGRLSWPVAARTAPSPLRCPPASRSAISSAAPPAASASGRWEREFRLGPEHRVALRGLLKSLAGEGAIAPARAIAASPRRAGCRTRRSCR